MSLPHESVRKDLIAHYAQVWDILRAEVSNPPLVLPNARFFPDAFSPTQAGVSTLLARMQTHAGISDIPVQVQFRGELSIEAGGCGEGACAPAAANVDQPRIVDTGEYWLLSIGADEVRHPVALTTLLARSLGAIMLEEVRGLARVPEPANLSCDLAAVQLGLGCLLLEGSYIYTKSCGGPNIATLTALGVSEVAVAVALFAAQHGHRLGAAKRSASTTQGAALGLAEDFVAGNPSVVQTLRASPTTLAATEFDLKPPKARWWGVFNKDALDY